MDKHEKYTNGLYHVAYGMVHLKSGKMSTREGNVIKVNDLVEETIKKGDINNIDSFVYNFIGEVMIKIDDMDHYGNGIAHKDNKVILVKLLSLQ